MTMTITLDTSVTPAEVMATVPEGAFDFAVVSVTEREVAGTDYEVTLRNISHIAETGVWGESRWGQSLWGGPKDTDCFEEVLSIISGNTFARRGHRDNLTPGRQRQVRDAMIFCAHIRERRDVFVTEDRKGFVNEGRRERLQQKFNTNIMTKDEFLAAYGKPSC